MLQPHYNISHTRRNYCGILSLHSVVWCILIYNHTIWWRTENKFLFSCNSSCPYNHGSLPVSKFNHKSILPHLRTPSLTSTIIAPSGIPLHLGSYRVTNTFHCVTGENASLICIYDRFLGNFPLLLRVFKYVARRITISCLLKTYSVFNF